MIATTLAMAVLTFAAAPSEGTWAPNGGLMVAQNFSAAGVAWTNPPWAPVPFIMAAEVGGAPAAAPQLMMMGIGW